MKMLKDIKRKHQIFIQKTENMYNIQDQNQGVNPGQHGMRNICTHYSNSCTRTYQCRGSVTV